MIAYFKYMLIHAGTHTYTHNMHVFVNLLFVGTVTCYVLIRMLR